MASFREIDPELAAFQEKFGGPQLGVGPSAGMVDTRRLAAALRLLSGMTRDSFLPAAGRAPVRAHPEGIRFMARALQPETTDFLPRGVAGQPVAAGDSTRAYLQILRDLLTGGMH